jgi:site-specific DNA-methyltransferase (adenine-specific)
MNTLYYGDNLKILKSLYKEKKSFIDLIYIDPPFNSKRNYNILFEDLIKTAENGEKTTALKKAFSDTWSNVSLAHELEELKELDNLKLYNFLTGNRPVFSDSQMSYLTMMAHRLYYMHKLLKNTGNFYLHCDPTMSHYLKVLMDIIFGEKNFRNEIVWHYRRWTAVSKRFQKLHDIILYYGKSSNTKFNVQYEPYGEWIEKDYKYFDEEKEKYWRWHTVKGNRYKVYLEDRDKGVKIGDVWSINPIGSKAKERLGYPTQKPESLLNRIIEASSNEGDIVADFFCGCGTAVAVAEKLNRGWIGVDINHLAIGLIEEKRLKPLKAKYKVMGFPNDLAQAEKLAKERPFEFERWIVEYTFKGHCTRKTRDGGFDGHIAFDDGLTNKKLCLLEVKGGKCTVKNVREFDNVVRAQKADMGFFICFEKQVTSEMKKHCDQQGFIKIENNLFPEAVPKLSIITIEEILNQKFPYWMTMFLQNITY